MKVTAWETLLVNTSASRVLVLSIAGACTRFNTLLQRMTSTFCTDSDHAVHFCCSIAICTCARTMAARFSVLAIVAASVLADVALSWKSVSVEDYGAVGDNRTDNTKAFREALLAVRDGGEVVVPFGKTCENPTTACLPPHRTHTTRHARAPSQPRLCNTCARTPCSVFLTECCNG